MWHLQHFINFIVISLFHSFPFLIWCVLVRSGCVLGQAPSYPFCRVLGQAPLYPFWLLWGQVTLFYFSNSSSDLNSYPIFLASFITASKMFVFVFELPCNNIISPLCRLSNTFFLADVSSGCLSSFQSS